MNNLKISTITITARLPYSETYTINNIKGNVKNNFKNQVTIKKEYTKGDIVRNVSIKIFNSGKLQITGILYIDMFIDIYLYIIYKCIEDGVFYLDIDNIVLNNKWVKDTSCMKIEMINSNINCNIKLDLYVVQSILVNEYNILAMYNPLTYAAVNVKYITKNGERVTILIFNSGNFMITGAKGYETLKETDIFRLNFLRDNVSRIKIRNEDILINEEKTNYENIRKSLTYSF